MSLSGEARRFERVRELFERLLEVSPMARDEILESECGTDEELKQQVRDLLIADRHGADRRTEPGAGGVWLAKELGAEMDESEQPAPARVGAFDIAREIGRGGMGVVYEARQREPARRVALKLIHPRLLSASMLRRFRRETRALAALRHPGIVQLYEVGTEQGAAGGLPRPYLVMELVEGEALGAFVKAHQPSVAERLSILAMLCDAIHHAHQKGVIHRDLKPENILVQSLPAPSGSSVMGAYIGVQPKILDFGVSRLLDADHAATEHTHAGQVVGTVPYLSPEQAEGNSEATDTRSDVYSLGVIAFELLTGRLPWDVKGLLITMALQAILTTQPQRLRTIAPSLHPDVQTIVQKAMHLDPAQRYASAAELGADIRRFLAHEPILARAPSWNYVIGRFVRRHRVLTGVTVASVTLVAASVIAMAIAWSDARRTREQAVWQRYLSAMSAASVALPGGDIATARRELDGTPPEHRGWEFRHMYTRLDQSRRCLKLDFPSPFVAAEVPGVGLTVASVTGAARVDDSGESGRPEALDPRLRLWLAAHSSVLPGSMPWSEGVVYWTRSVRGPIEASRLDQWPTWPVQSVHEARLSADGTMFAARVSGVRYAIITGRLADGKGFCREISVSDQVERIEISGEGKRIAVGFGGESPVPSYVGVFDALTGQEMSRTAALERKVTSIAMTTDGMIAAVALQNGSIQTWDLSTETGRLLASRAIDQDAPQNLSFSPDCSLLAAGSRDGLVRLWKADTLEPVADLAGHESEILGTGFSNDGSTILTTGRDSTIRMWDPAPAIPRPLVLRGHAHLVHGLALSASRRQVITGSWDKSVAIYSMDTGERLASVPVDNYVQRMNISPDERLVATWEYRQGVRVLDAVTLKTIRLIPVDTDLDAALLFDRESKRIATTISPARGTASVVDIETGATSEMDLSELSSFVGPTVNAKAGLIALTSARDSQFFVALCRFDDHREVFGRACRRVALESLAFSEVGDRFAILGNANEIDIYDTRTLRHLGTCRGHTREVLNLVFSPDGTRLFSADLTGVIRIWDTATFAEVGQLRGHQEHIRRLIISKDGKCLVSGSRDGTARVWAVP